ncbi:MAG: TonB-dependent receptor [Haliea sp.]|nr:TonB-dependent receptor [Haliea sp.]
MRSITAWRELRDKSYLDFSSGATGQLPSISPPPPSAPTPARNAWIFLPRPDLQQEQFSREFQLLGNFGESIEYLAGIYGFWEKATEDATPLHHIFHAYPFAGGTIYNLSSEYNEIKNDALAIFTQVTWTPMLERRLHLTLGGRFSRDSREAVREVTDQVVVDLDASLLNLVGPDYFAAES